jgi:hypothetical protein
MNFEIVLSLLLVCLLILLIVSYYRVDKYKEEKYTFADYDKIKCCWCPRDINII